MTIPWLIYFRMFYKVYRPRGNFRVCSPFMGQRPLPFTVHSPPSSVYRHSPPSSVLRLRGHRSQSTVLRWQFTVFRLPFTVVRLPFRHKIAQDRYRPA